MASLGGAFRERPLNFPNTPVVVARARARYAPPRFQERQRKYPPEDAVRGDGNSSAGIAQSREPEHRFRRTLTIRMRCILTAEDPESPYRCDQRVPSWDRHAKRPARNCKRRLTKQTRLLDDTAGSKALHGFSSPWKIATRDDITTRYGLYE